MHEKFIIPLKLITLNCSRLKDAITKVKNLKDYKRQLIKRIKVQKFSRIVKLRPT